MNSHDIMSYTKYKIYNNIKTKYYTKQYWTGQLTLKSTNKNNKKTHLSLQNALLDYIYE